MFASEAYFHPKCRKQYVQDPQYWRSQDTEAKLHQEKKETAHETAFLKKVCSVISKELLSNQTVTKLTDLVQLHVKELESTGVPNLNYRSKKLKDKFENRYGKQIAFCKLDTKRNVYFPSCLQFKDESGDSNSKCFSTRQ